MLIPILVGTLSAISGGGGIALGAKGAIDLIDASATDRATQMQNKENVLRFEACSEKLTESLENLGRQRMIVTKNFNVFINAFEKIKNRPKFVDRENSEFPIVEFDEIRNVSVEAEVILGTVVGTAVGGALAAAAASGTTAAIIALGTASTGTRISALSGAALEKAVLAQLGGGAISAGGGGIALGKLILNAASLGVGILVEGISLAYAGSDAKKKAGEAKDKMISNANVIYKATNMQVAINNDITKVISATAKICNNIYKPLALALKKLVSQKDDWNEFTEEEKLLVKNNIAVVQILHYLNNIPIYKVKTDDETIKQAEPNTNVINEAIEKAVKHTMNK